MTNFYQNHPFTDHKTKALRYFFENPNYRHGEAIILYCMLRHLCPKKILEIGSGYSSCAILDTNELFFGNSISYTFIDPYPQLLLSLIDDHDKSKISMVQNPVQEVNSDLFLDLSENDIFFIDSTHISKTGSDVNYILFEILPNLRSGVIVHFHDIYYPFEYPKQWIYEGRAWNEVYLLRAFLQYNSAFKIIFFNSFFAYAYGDRLASDMPLCMVNPGSSIWIKRV